MPRERLHPLAKWPERHGFSIGGSGPSYVLRVIKGSAADKQGLRRGDRIIELDSHNVVGMAAPALENFAKHMTSSMPTVKVVNEVQKVEIFATRIHRYGFSVHYSQRNGYTVENSDTKGPAHQAGIRNGDVILEMNGVAIYEKQDSLTMVHRLLSAHRGKLTMSVLPEPNIIKHKHKTNGFSRSNGAKDLYTKMGNLLGGNYEKKMALVGILKSYAEHQKVEKFAKALVLVLQTPEHRKILPLIRLHVPVRDRKTFDEIFQRSFGKNYGEERGQPHSSHNAVDFRSSAYSMPTQSANIDASSASLLYKRSLTIYRGDGDLGVILKGRCPVVVENILPNGAADRAGLLRGDSILEINNQSVSNCSHYDIQKLLKNSGPSVQMNVIQNVQIMEGSQPASNHGTLNGRSRVPDTRISSYDTLSSRSTNFSLSFLSGHGARGPPLPNGVSSRRLPNSLGSDDDLPHSTLSSNRSQLYSPTSDWPISPRQVANHDNPMTEKQSKSFKVQVNYLLDKKEKKEFKQCLLQYSNDKNIEKFLQEVQSILDTPAKQQLWNHVLPILSQSHKEYVQNKVDIPTSEARREDAHNNTASALPDSPSLEPEGPLTMSYKSQLDFLLTSKERKVVKESLEQYKQFRNVESLVQTLTQVLDTDSKMSIWSHILPLLTSSHQTYVKRKVKLPLGLHTNQRHPPSKPSRSRRNRILTQSDDEFFVVGDGGDESEDEDYDLSQVHITKYHAKGSYRHHDDTALPGADHFHENPIYGRPKRSSETMPDPGISAYDMINFPQSTTNSYRRGRANTAMTPSHLLHTQAVVHQEPQLHRELDLQSPRSAASDSVTNGHHHGSYDVSESMSSSAISSLQKHMKQALRAMDDAVQDQSSVSDASTPTDLTSPSSNSDSHVNLDVPLPPIPPPPPPIPVPPPLPDTTAPLTVKRLNWETHNPVEIDKTIWGRRGSDHLDVGDMVEYLELEQQFSTVKKKPAVIKRERPRFMKILGERKAFNMSIILANLNRSPEQFRNALLECDLSSPDSFLSTHLLQQLLQYAPDESETALYESFNGQLSEISEVDRFVYEMIKIPGYKPRLQSMLFKATFDEKCQELEQHLRLVRTGSLQIIESNSLAKILEMVLAMGNQLNKAVNRPVASAFRISFLTDLDSTKTADKKRSFLDVLVQAVDHKMPHILSSIWNELSQVALAERVLQSVSVLEVSREIADLQKVLYNISERIGQLTVEAKHFSAQDRFQDVMEHFISAAEDRLQHLSKLESESRQSHDAMIRYLGENEGLGQTGSRECAHIFSVIHTFLLKLDSAQKQLHHRS